MNPYKNIDTSSAKKWKKKSRENSLIKSDKNPTTLSKTFEEKDIKQDF